MIVAKIIVSSIMMPLLIPQREPINVMMTQSKVKVR